MSELRQTTPQFWRIDRVREETGLCTRVIYQMMAEGTFPKNFAISPQARAWASDEVDAWKATKLANRVPN
jgi:prophage regulatory protein